jgi:hypothetical protein
MTDIYYYAIDASNDKNIAMHHECHEKNQSYRIFCVCPHCQHAGSLGIRRFGPDDKGELWCANGV